MTQFKIKLEATHAKVEVDGHDVSSAVTEVHVHRDGPVAVPYVALVLYGEKVEIEGTGIVESVGDPSAIAKVITSLDPQTVEKEALDRAPGMGNSLVPALLNVVAEMVSGRTS